MVTTIFNHLLFPVYCFVQRAHKCAAINFLMKLTVAALPARTLCGFDNGEVRGDHYYLTLYNALNQIYHEADFERTKKSCWWTPY